MQSFNSLGASWDSYNERKNQNGQDPNCFSPEELWEFDYLVNMILKSKPHLEQLTVILAVREGMRRTIAPRPRQHFVELVMENINERENQWLDLLQTMQPDPKIVEANVAPIKSPILILVGTEDRLLGIDTVLHDQLAQQGKRVRMEIYEHGYHDFVLGNQGQDRKDLSHGEILLQGALDALDLTVKFVKSP